MGKAIDRLAILGFGIGIGFFVLYLSFRAVMPALVGAFLFCAGAYYLLKKIQSNSAWRIRKKRRKLAEAYLDDVMLHKKASNVLRELLPEGSILQFHLPDHMLSRDEVYKQWYASKAETQLVLATTGGVSRGALLLASELSEPGVRLLSRRDMADLLAQSDITIPEKRLLRSKQRWLLHIQGLLANSQVSAGRCLFYAAVSIILYVPTGSSFLLASGVCAAFSGLVIAYIKRPFR